MKIYLLAIVALVTCARTIPEDFTMQRFNQWDSKEQARFINSLSREERMKLLPMLFMHNCFHSPPHDYIRFFEDGTAIVDWFTGNAMAGGRNWPPGSERPITFFKLNWKIETGTLTCWRNNYDESFGGAGDFFNKKMEWTDYVARTGILENQKDLYLDFLPERSNFLKWPNSECTDAIKEYARRTDHLK